MPKTIRIGEACGFHGDSPRAPAQLLQAGVGYLTLDYLAEATMSVLGQAMDFAEWAWKGNLHALRPVLLDMPVKVPASF